MRAPIIDNYRHGGDIFLGRASLIKTAHASAASMMPPGRLLKYCLKAHGDARRRPRLCHDTIYCLIGSLPLGAIFSVSWDCCRLRAAQAGTMRRRGSAGRDISRKERKTHCWGYSL